jgi:hypothetical protein
MNAMSKIIKIQFMTSIELLHVLAPECHHGESHRTRGCKSNIVCLGINCPHWYNWNIKILEYTELITKNLHRRDVKMTWKWAFSGTSLQLYVFCQVCLQTSCGPKGISFCKYVIVYYIYYFYLLFLQNMRPCYVMESICIGATYKTLTVRTCELTYAFCFGGKLKAVFI